MMTALDAQENSGPPHALELPDILLHILQYLEHDRTSLCSAILVKSGWVEEGTNVLWRRPPVTALAFVAESRRQVYATKIHELYFSGDREGAHHVTFRHLRFPRLKRISIDFYKSDGDKKLWIGQYLQPSLVYFHLYGGDPVEEDLLGLLRTRCPRLRGVLIDRPRNGLDPERFLGFLKNCRSVTTMIFLIGMDDLITDEVFLYLAGRDNIEELGLGKGFKRATIENVLEQIPDPFKALRQLTVRVESCAVASLALAAKSVWRLNLGVEDNGCEVLQTIASLTNLSFLEVTFLCERKISSAELMALRSLTQLRRLDLQPIDTQLHALTLTDEDFGRLMSSFRGLQHLCFLVQTNLTIAAIKSLGRHCVSLEHCEMFGSYDLDALSYCRAPLFPCLEQLELDSAEVEETEER